MLIIMKTRIIWSYITLMAFLSLVSATSKPFAPHDLVAHKQDQIPQPPQSASFDSNNGVGNEEEEEEYRAQSRLGSRPPNCGHKCGGCFPCEPVQTPATADRIGVQIANYEPEGWKCKCGLSFFNP